MLVLAGGRGRGRQDRLHKPPDTARARAARNRPLRCNKPACPPARVATTDCDLLHVLYRTRIVG